MAWLNGSIYNMEAYSNLWTGYMYEVACFFLWSNYLKTCHNSKYHRVWWTFSPPLWHSVISMIWKDFKWLWLLAFKGEWRPLLPQNVDNLDNHVCCMAFMDGYFISWTLWQEPLIWNRNHEPYRNDKTSFYHYQCSKNR